MKETKLICEICGNEYEPSEEHVVNGMHMCQYCFELGTVTCRHCGERVLVDDTVDDDLCEGCYEMYYIRCDGCDRVISLDDAYYLRDDYDREYPYCHDCYHEHEDDQIIHDYYYKPEPIFYGTGRRYYGVELEIDESGECDCSAEKILGVANKVFNHLYIKHDGSLDDGFEMVSHPMTLEYHLHNMPWQKIMQKAIELEYRSHQARTCGLHVHISRKGLGNTYEEQEATIAKILYFYEKFWNEILKFSRRTEGQANRWARRYGGGLINPKETLKHAKSACLGRYVAVNLENENTVEMRIFRGTLKYSTFAATLQMVDEICDVAVSLSDEELQNLTWLDFVQRITSDKQELIDYLKVKRLYVNEPVTANEEV